MSKQEISDIVPFVGSFNNNYPTEINGAWTLRRVPHANRDMFTSWKSHIYPATGFTGDGGRLRLRTPSEQYEFSLKAAAEGLAVLPPQGIDKKDIFNPFLVDAQHLDTYLRNNPEDQGRMIGELFYDLYRAHTKGFIYGDRWAPNILVVPQLGPHKFGFVHVDFDFEISGPTAKELEVAEVTLAVLSVGDSTIPILATQLGTRNQWFDFPTVAKYMKRRGQIGERDKDLGEKIETLIETTYALRTHVGIK